MHFKVFTVVRYFSNQATQVYYFSRDSRSVAMAAVSLTFSFRFSFRATTPLSLEPYFTEELLSSPSTSLSRNDRRSLILSPKILFPLSSLSKAPVFLSQTLNKNPGLHDSTNRNKITVYLSEVIPIDSKASK